MMNDVVIVGGGLAGATAAQTLRAEGFTGTITLVCQENHLPYLRPPLSKGFLAGREDETSLLPYTADDYTEHGIELLEGEAAVAINRAAATVTLAQGRVLEYGQLLLATGASPRTLEVPGAGLPGVHYLRTLEDSRSLRESLKRAGPGQGRCRVVLVGSGWIGMEVAATATTLGAEVTVLGRDKVPLAAAIGPELGRVFMDRQKEAGVKFYTETIVTEIVERDGRAAGVTTGSGSYVPADVIVVAVGVAPNTALAEAAGLSIDNGILTDGALRTDDPRILAAGDAANPYHPFIGGHLRSEHWANAISSGKVAARTMMGKTAQLDDVPYFYTDQFDLGMEYSGYSSLASNAKMVLRGDPASRKFIAFWLMPVSSTRGWVVAGMSVNVWDIQDDIKFLISSGHEVQTSQLSDPDIPLGEL
ncbi:3-phenylpropionate/trans-cinnamate dioxygenase ferredoxin reductase subunit [Pseudarthrobacter defluvii]|uniref:NAD(P)/FAD-dependent oxidoreductase n=1 Tax=Pseudarthrobacter defluvii TaxID=410837 RepID=UPI00278B0EE7|nr:FAD-dependent oxidoreductase [Pseudarthrobacter defluvii]MDQ0769499.1 3-phenylpropionate/trans-cinnamate dioxygenase ferredoxin reductase subunit [Pseudarthrobacter defluvii]